MPIYHLYTAWGLVLATLLIVRLLRGPSCQHEWKVAVERELPSKAEELKKAGENIAVGWSMSGLRLISSKTFCAILVCQKCGATREFIVKT